MKKTISLILIIVACLLLYSAFKIANKEIGNIGPGPWFHATPFNCEPFHVQCDVNGNPPSLIYTKENRAFSINSSAASLNQYLSQLKDKARIFKFLTFLLSTISIVCVFFLVSSSLGNLKKVIFLQTLTLMIYLTQIIISRLEHYFYKFINIFMLKLMKNCQ